jgi:phage protein
LNQAAEKEESKLKKRLSKYYDSEFRKLEKQIAAYYQEYGENNVIEYRKLMEALSDEDKRLLIEQMDEFAKRYPQYAHLMPVRESIYKLNRLEGLQYSVIMRQAEIAGLDNDEITSHLNRLAAKGINYSMEALGFGKNFYSVNSNIIKRFVDVPWSNGENFSKRIWNDTQKLAQYLNQDIAQGIARGDSYDRLVRQLRKRFSDVNRRDVYRLIYTEGTYVMAESTIQPFAEDFEYYKLSPLMDEKTCTICRGLADKMFKISERQPGVNFPPIHPWCRCTWEIEVSGWDKWIDDYVKKHGGNKKQAETIENRLKSDSKSNIIKLPRYWEAAIPRKKFLEYALNPQKDQDKAKAFKSALGYTMENADDLIQQIYDKLPEYEAKEKTDKGWGKRYEVRMELTGPNGKTAKVITAWIDDKNTGQMRLTSAYIDKE